MKISARALDQTTQPVIEYGIVHSLCDGVYMISTESGVIEATRSVSCLIAPQASDVVLVSIDEAGISYILSILKRPEPSRTGAEISLEGDVHFNVRNGALTFTSENALSLSSPKFEVNAHQGTIRIDKTTFFGRFVENNIEKLRLVAESVDSIIKRAVQRFTSSYRYVEEHEEVKSASTRMIVDGTLTMHTKNTMHIAEGHVKIDAGQIHLG